MKEKEQQHENERAFMLELLKEKEMMLKEKRWQIETLTAECENISAQCTKKKVMKQQLASDEIIQKCYNQLNNERDRLQQTLEQLQMQNQYNEELFKTYYDTLGLEPHQDFLQQIKRAEEHLFE